MLTRLAQQRRWSLPASSWRLVLLAALSCPLAPACAADGAAADASWLDAPPSGDGGVLPACTFAAAAAQFRISGGDHGGFSGAYRDHPTPQLMIEQVRAGACAFYAAQTSFCEPGCTGGLCVGGTCVPWPINLDAGTLAITGTTPALVVEQQAGGSYYTTESYPDLFQPGDPITLSGPGGRDVAPFEVEVRGVPELAVDWDRVDAVEHQEMVVTWRAATSPPGTRVIVHMDSDHHGMSAFVECVADDTGSVAVDPSVLDPLIEAGRTGIGTFIENAYMARANASAVDTGSGCVAFQAESLISIAVRTVLAE